MQGQVEATSGAMSNPVASGSLKRVRDGEVTPPPTPENTIFVPPSKSPRKEHTREASSSAAFSESIALLSPPTPESSEDTLFASGQLMAGPAVNDTTNLSDFSPYSSVASSSSSNANYGLPALSSSSSTFDSALRDSPEKQLLTPVTPLTLSQSASPWTSSPNALQRAATKPPSDIQQHRSTQLYPSPAYASERPNLLHTKTDGSAGSGSSYRGSLDGLGGSIPFGGMTNTMAGLGLDAAFTYNSASKVDAPVASIAAQTDGTKQRWEHSSPISPMRMYNVSRETRKGIDRGITLEDLDIMQTLGKPSSSLS